MSKLKMKIIVALMLALFSTHAYSQEIYTTGFELGSFENKDGFVWESGVKTAVTKEQAKTGDYSLKFSYFSAPQGGDSFSEQRFKLGGYYDELWIEYDLFIPSNYNHRNDRPTNNKWPLMLWTGDYRDKQRTKLGGHLWAKSNGESEFIAYQRSAIKGRTKSVNWWCSSCGNGKSSEAVTKNDYGKWMHLKIHVKYASKANNDGVYEIWKTNWQGKTTKIIDIQDGDWYSVNADGTIPAKGFDRGYLLGWSNSGFNKNTAFYIDNFSVSTNKTAQPKPEPEIKKIPKAVNDLKITKVTDLNYLFEFTRITESTDDQALPENAINKYFLFDFGVWQHDIRPDSDSFTRNVAPGLHEFTIQAETKINNLLAVSDMSAAVSINAEIVEQENPILISFEIPPGSKAIVEILPR